MGESKLPLFAFIDETGNIGYMGQLTERSSAYTGSSRFPGISLRLPDSSKAIFFVSRVEKNICLSQRCSTQFLIPARMPALRCITIISEHNGLLLTYHPSAGIQIADVILWLYRQHHKKKLHSRGCQALLNCVFMNGWEPDPSFEGASENMRRPIYRY